MPESSRERLIERIRRGDKSVLIDIVDTLFSKTERRARSSTATSSTSAVASVQEPTEFPTLPVTWDTLPGKPDSFPTTEVDPTVPDWVKDIMSDDIDEWDRAARGEFDWIDFNTALAAVPLKIGRLAWDPDAETIAVYLPNGVRLQIGQEMVTPRSKNTSGVDITDGQVVYIKGASGNSPEVGLANASDPDKSKVIAVATSTTLNNNHGVFTSFGMVHDVNTNVAGWNEGDELFLDIIDGQMTNVAPDRPNIRVSIGYLVRKHAVNGSILVAIHRTPTLEEIGALDVDSIEEGGMLTGFVDPANVVQTMSADTLSVTITHPSGKVRMRFRGNTIIEKDSPWVLPDRPDTTDENWFYSSADGVNFAWHPYPWAFEEILVAYIRNGVNLKFGVRECHGMMDPTAHRISHETVGTIVEAGGTLTAGTYDIQGTASDANNTPGIDVTTVNDEDLATVLPALPQGSYSVVFKSGSVFDIAAANALPFTFTPGGYINWFNDGTETQGAQGKFYNVYVIGIPAMADAASQALRWLWLAPQHELTEDEAAAETIATQFLGDLELGITEYVPRFKITFTTSASWSSSGKCRIHAIETLSRSRITALPSTTPEISGSGTPGDIAIWATASSLGSVAIPREFIQGSAAVAWVVPNPTLRAPFGITVIDSAGEQCGCKVQHAGDWSFFTCTFSSAISGRVTFF